MTACRDKAQFDYADRLPSPQELAKLEPVLNLSLPEHERTSSGLLPLFSRSSFQVL